jgi:hypothetical protein
LAAELAPAAAGDGASQVTVADHIADREVFDHDEISFADQAGAGAVQEIPSRVADLAVRAGDLGSGLGPVRRPLLAAGQAPLVARQAAGLALQVPGIGDPLPAARDGEVHHAKVDADHAAGLLQGFWGIGVNGEGYVPMSVRLAGDDYHRRVERGYVHIGPGPHEPYRNSHLGQPQLASAHGERAPGVVRGLPGPAGLEPRVPGAPGEERLECSVLMPQRLLQRHRGHLGQERQLRILLHGGQRPIGLRIRHAFAFQVPQAMAGVQGAVPHDPDTAERTAQHRLLCRIRVRPAPVSRPHPYMIARVIEKHREPRRTGDHLFVPRFAGNWVSPGPEGQGIRREAW